MSRPMQFNLWFMPFEELLQDVLQLNEIDQHELEEQIKLLESLLEHGKVPNPKLKDRIYYAQMRYDFIRELISRLYCLDYFFTIKALEATHKHAKACKLKRYGFSIFFVENQLPEFIIY